MSVFKRYNYVTKTIEECQMASQYSFSIHTLKKNYYVLQNFKY